MEIKHEERERIIEQIKRHVDQGELDTAISLLHELRAPDEAEVLAHLNQDQIEVLIPCLSYEESAKVLQEMEPSEAARICQTASTETVAHILDKAGPDVAAHVIRDLPEEQAKEVLEAMEEKEGVEPLLSYAPESAGRLMSIEYVALSQTMTVHDAIALLRRLRPPREAVNTLFVVDRDGILRGSLTLEDLILADSEARISALMDRDVISVGAGTDREESARIMEHYHLLALPVVSEEQQLLGVIQLKDAVEVIEEEATEDMYKMVGLSTGERIPDSMLTSIRRRLPWLTLNLSTAFLAAVVVGFFEQSITRVIALAVFLPVIAGQGANAGAQTLTIMVRSLALGEITLHDAKRTLLKEGTLALINGLVIAVVAGVVAFLWKGSLSLALVLGLAMLGTMLVAGLSGALVPLGLKLFRIDPAVASSVFVTTVTDVAGFFFLLGLATLMMQYLV